MKRISFTEMLDILEDENREIRLVRAVDHNTFAPKIGMREEFPDGTHVYLDEEVYMEDLVELDLVDLRRHNELFI